MGNGAESLRVATAGSPVSISPTTGLKTVSATAIEALSALTDPDLSLNRELSGMLPERLADISGFSDIDIRCVGPDARKAL